MVWSKIDGLRNPLLSHPKKSLAVFSSAHVCILCVWPPENIFFVPSSWESSLRELVDMYKGVIHLEGGPLTRNIAGVMPVPSWGFLKSWFKALWPLGELFSTAICPIRHREKFTGRSSLQLRSNRQYELPQGNDSMHSIKNWNYFLRCGSFDVSIPAEKDCIQGALLKHRIERASPIFRQFPRIETVEGHITCRRWVFIQNLALPVDGILLKGFMQSRSEGIYHSL